MKYFSFLANAKMITDLLTDYKSNNILVLNYTNKKLLKLFDNYERNFLTECDFFISCFTGLIDEDPSSILSRVPSHLILFNCKKDFVQYIKLGKELNFSTDNGYCFGYPQLIGVQPTPVDQQQDICFFEQVIVPATFSERCYLLKKLVDLAIAFPDKKVWIKPRCKPGERTIHKQIWHLETLRRLMRIKFPKNLEFTYESVESLLSCTGLCLTISSTVAIEALARKIPTAILSDFGVRKDIHTASFVGSGCLVTIDQLIAGYIPEPNQEWLDDHVQIPDIDALKIKLDELLKKKEQGLLVRQAYPEGAFSKAKDFTPTLLKKTKKLLADPAGFCADSKYAALNRVGAFCFRKSF